MSAETKPDGGPAFPGERIRVFAIPGASREKAEPYGGMSKRDYFAAQALTGALASGAWLRTMKELGVDSKRAATYIAEGCYEAADAMLKAREQ